MTTPYELRNVTHATQIQNSGLIFRCLWTKVHQIKLIAVCNAVFRSTIGLGLSCFVSEIGGPIRDQVVKLSKIWPNYIYDVVGRPCFFFGGGGHISDQIL